MNHTQRTALLVAGLVAINAVLALVTPLLEGAVQWIVLGLMLTLTLYAFRLLQKLREGRGK
ncbi:hypothetical protein [Parvularcula lutaonensis]|uniref:Uncharacterized protein n=1 Tax=Parvularcula lutaonensis TaxID=491923 RepID=A0ABV7M7D1_9PROT|nr:hypothetical protein [Parvularcula lutaonensis]GGY41608.1 hypothetical protein GCM10007148_07760 [Parvularcula lutaonensis]